MPVKFCKSPRTLFKVAQTRSCVLPHLCAVLCCAVLRCAVLCCAVLCCSGEIACRVLTTAKRLGIPTVAVFRYGTGCVRKSD